MPLKTEKPNGHPDTAYRIFKAFQAIFDKISAQPPNEGPTNQKKINLLVAFSGGCDSVCLLRSLAEFKDPRKGAITAVHVHHGISPNADSWAKFAEEVAKDCDIPFVLQKVNVEKTGLGLEAEARRLRYLALSKVAQEIGANTIFTAHHRDDQLETFLIQWMRGAGIEGLAGMPAISDDSIPISRPFLDLGRKELEQYAERRGWKWVDDESNNDTSYLRNLIRLKILPVLDQARPGYRAAAARSIQLLAESAMILKATDEEDFFSVCTVEGNEALLRVSSFQKLSPPKKSRLLRHWLRTQGIPQVPKHRIDIIVQRLGRWEEVDTLRLMQFGDKELWIKDGNLLVREAAKKLPDYDIIFQWKGERAIEIPELNGRLLFVESDSGFPANWLKEKPLSISLRKGKDRIKTRSDSPPKLIKVLCQEAGLDPTDREKLPVVRRGGQIIYAGGLGAEVRGTIESAEGQAVSIRWQGAPKSAIRANRKTRIENK